MKISVDHPNKPPSPNRPSLKAAAMSCPQSLKASPKSVQSPSISANNDAMLSTIEPDRPPIATPIAVPIPGATKVPIKAPMPAPTIVQLTASAMPQPSLPSAQAFTASLIPLPKAAPISPPRAVPIPGHIKLPIKAPIPAPNVVQLNPCIICCHEPPLAKASIPPSKPLPIAAPIKPPIAAPIGPPIMLPIKAPIPAPNKVKSNACKALRQSPESIYS